MRSRAGLIRMRCMRLYLPGHLGGLGRTWVGSWMAWW